MMLSWCVTLEFDKLINNVSHLLAFNTSVLSVHQLDALFLALFLAYDHSAPKLGITYIKYNNASVNVEAGITYAMR